MQRVVPTRDLQGTPVAGDTSTAARKKPGAEPGAAARLREWLRGYEKLWDVRIERLVELLRHPENEPE